MTGPRAIFVPTSRSTSVHSPGVKFALDLGDRLGCPVVFICSAKAKASDFAWWRLPPGRSGPVFALDFDDIHPAWWATNELLKARNSLCDVADKRNLALAMSTALGWGRIFFLDDDMRPDPRSDGLNVSNILHAAQVMQAWGLAAVGWSCEDFPDNSVVCHARRLAGLPQGNFIGGGALLVDVAVDTPHFPDVYNEDWFFLIALASLRPDAFRAIGLAGTISQEPYNPFVRSRVERQEFGDVIAECLVNLVEDGKSLATDEVFWRRAIASRVRHIALLNGMLAALALGRLGRRQEQRRDALRSLVDAQDVLRQIDPGACTDWVAGWQSHRGAWKRHLAALTGICQDLMPDEVIVDIAEGKPPGSRKPKSV